MLLRSFARTFVHLDKSSTFVVRQFSAQAYRFTRDSPKLTTEQRDFYEKNGYLHLKGVFEESELQRYKQRFEDLACGKVKSPGLTIMRDVALLDEKNPDKYIVNKVQDLHYDEVLFEYCRHPRILDYVDAFIGPNQMAVHTMLVNKPPDPGTKTSRHPLHQDQHFFPFRPAEKIVCAWTALERVHRDNGCMVVVPESHLGPLLDHGYPQWVDGVNKLYHGIENFDDYADKRHHIEMDAGDTIMFNPLLIHGSGTNKTKGFRKVLSCHFAASDCEYFDVTSECQTRLAAETLEMLRKKGIKIASFKDVWRLRAQLVKGDRLTM